MTITNITYKIHLFPNLCEIISWVDLFRSESTHIFILAESIIVPYGKISQPALTAINNIPGGDFTSRLNMNLMEDKHWTYVAGSVVFDGKSQQPIMSYISVQIDKTREAIQ